MICPVLERFQTKEVLDALDRAVTGAETDEVRGGLRSHPPGCVEPGRGGGLDQVATILSELAGRIDPDLLAVAAGTAPVPWAQRLGYLLERIGAVDKTAPLKAHVRRCARDVAPLLPAGSRDRAPRAADWRLRINAEVEAEA